MSRRSTDWPPLWDGDPTPGNPDEVAALGRKLRKMADMIDEQARVVKALASVEGWDSEAGRAFNEIADGAGDRLKKSFERYDEAAKALGTKVADGSKEFASELDRAQRKADKALADYREAESDHDLADREVKKFTDKHLVSEIPEADKSEYERWEKKRDDALHRIGQARKDVKDAKEIFDDAGENAARHIKNVVHHDSVRDPGGFMNFLADWADGFANISAILSAAAVFCAFVPPLQFLVPLLATAAVLTSAAALAGHAYDMRVRGGKVSWWKLTVDVLGVMPGLGVLKGFTALKGLKGLSKLKGLGMGFKTSDAIKGIGFNALNGVSVTVTNRVLAVGTRLGGKLKLGKLPDEFVPIEGKKITAVIKGTGLAGALNRMFNGENGERTGDQKPYWDTPSPETSPTPSPPTGGQDSPTTTTPSPSPAASPAPFHAALAA
ncbi:MULTISPECIES: putative T7SS-secreted protein [unclassified Streptomyces]|uniref:putative T7SS-secreted protein n=1 Tax=unclassified Streptomyces TaxID=2593676 RepID=UPI0036E47205